MVLHVQPIDSLSRFDKCLVFCALFQDILAHWLKLGISGFRLANTQYLTEDPDLHDESRSILPLESNNYQSLTHVHTRNRQENAAVLSNWREIVRNATDGQG